MTLEERVEELVKCNRELLEIVKLHQKHIDMQTEILRQLMKIMKGE